MKVSLFTLRRLTQIIALLILVAVPFVNVYFRYHAISGNLLSFDLFGFPFNDPTAALQVVLSTFSFPFHMVAGALVVLCIALLCGPIFCSWLCPYGLFSELIYEGRKKIIPTKSAIASISTKRSSEKTYLSFPFSFIAKGAIFSMGLLLSLIIAQPILTMLSMPGWISRSFQHAMLYKELVWGLWIVAFLLFVELVFHSRFWCRFLCPQSFLLSLSGMLLPKRLTVMFTKHSCTCHASHRDCLNACPLQLNPRKKTLSFTAQCTNCGNCIEACKKKGKALTFGIGNRNK